ncbi:GNAT family N-acetyltransferase [Flexithrix dorotheae]|uniref:GNAT family N-acetyltransferase n=1 Tax=Flexithrix dorotheae TaxID=70993 RepID=UPI000367455D|nr:GNAT family N-acetyltransferase [Flexithrix dorotheae]
MEAKINIRKLDPYDLPAITKIANWYQEEWETPKERTISRLTNQPSEDVLFQLVLSLDGVVVGSGGVGNEVSIFREYENLRIYQPWVALLYIDEDYRNRGFGKMLLDEIENCARQQQLEKLYLYTFTAESLYKKCGWKEIERVIYKGHDTVVMEKEI